MYYIILYFCCEFILVIDVVGGLVVTPLARFCYYTHKRVCFGLKSSHYLF